HETFARNKQLSSIFAGPPPALADVTVCELLFKAGGPLYFSADLPSQPKEVPERWKQNGYTNVQLRFSVFLLGPPVIVGTPLSSARCEVSFGEQAFRIRALDGSWSIEGPAALDGVFAEPY